MRTLEFWVVLLLSVVLIVGCKSTPRVEPFLAQHTYTTMHRDGTPLLSINGVSDDWIIHTSHLERGILTASWRTVDNNGSRNGSVSFGMTMAVSDGLISSSNIFLYDYFFNRNYTQRAEFIKNSKYNEQVIREVGYKEVIVEPTSFRGLHCMKDMTARATTHHGGYMLNKRIHCPIVIDNNLGGFVFTYTVTHWQATLEDLQADYGEDYLRAVFAELEGMLKESMDSLKFHVGFSQNPEELVGYDYPPVPEGMNYTDFYLDVMPKQFQLLTLPYQYPWKRILTTEDVAHMKSMGLTLDMAKEWRTFFEKARDTRETFLRNHSARRKTEEGIQIDLQREKDLVRLFEETIELWDKVPAP